MSTEVFVRRVRIPAPAAEVFRWHLRPGAFERLAPPWEPLEVVERTGGIADGGRVVLRLRIGPLANAGYPSVATMKKTANFATCKSLVPLPARSIPTGSNRTVPQLVIWKTILSTPCRSDRSAGCLAGRSLVTNSNACSIIVTISPCMIFFRGVREEERLP